MRSASRRHAGISPRAPEFKDGGVTQKVLLKDRLAKLIEAIDAEPSLQYSVTYLYYSRSDSPLPDVCLDPDFPGSLRAIVNCV